MTSGGRRGGGGGGGGGVVVSAGPEGCSSSSRLGSKALRLGKLSSLLVRSVSDLYKAGDALKMKY